MPATCGSISRSRPRRRCGRRSGTRFSIERRSISRERGELGLIDSDDELADLAVRQPLLLAELADLDATCRAQLGLQRPRLVVQTRVHDAGVAARLMLREPRLLLEMVTSLPGGEQPCEGDAHDAPADDPDALRSCLGPGSSTAGGQRPRRRPARSEQCPSAPRAAFRALASEDERPRDAADDDRPPGDLPPVAPVVLAQEPLQPGLQEHLARPRSVLVPAPTCIAVTSSAGDIAPTGPGARYCQSASSA